MTKLKIIALFGTRPEAIKLAPVINEIRNRSDLFDFKVCVTGQHREMLYQTLSIFDITPDIDLEIMEPGQTLANLTARVLQRFQLVLDDFNPNILIVHGDTSSALAGALTAFYNQISVVHVEAGLRTWDFKAPFPEEFNRQVISKISQTHFAPTNLNRLNLIAEGVQTGAIITTGNTVIDALLSTKQKILTDGSFEEQIKHKLKSRLNLVAIKCDYILVTGHRRENFGRGFKEICNSLIRIALHFPTINIIYPVHLNPAVRETVQKLLADIKNIHLIDPVGYDEFVYLMMHCKFIMTDSGGIQEEAPSLGKPVLVLRDNTERSEAVEAGTVELVGTDEDTIFKSAERLLIDHAHYMRMATAPNPYGDGNAAMKIIQALIKSEE